MKTDTQYLDERGVVCIRVLYIQRNMYIISVGCTVSAYGRALLSCTRFSNITYVELEFRERTVIVDPSEAGISRDAKQNIVPKTSVYFQAHACQILKCHSTICAIEGLFL